MVDLQIHSVFGFVADANLTIRHNAYNYLSTMPTWTYFNRPTNMAFHDLTTRLKPPPNLRSLLGLSLKFIPNPRYNVSWDDYKNITIPKLIRDLKVKIFFADTPPDPDFNQRMYAPSDWKPPEQLMPQSLTRRLDNLESALKEIVKKKKGKQNLMNHQREALSYLRKQKDFLIVQCDKNLGPAIIEREEYIKFAIIDHLSDHNTYQRLSQRESERKAIYLRDQIRSWTKTHKRVISKSEKKFILHNLDQNTAPFAAFYLMMKVHKTPLATRPIVSCSGSLLHAHLVSG